MDSITFCVSIIAAITCKIISIGGESTAGYIMAIVTIVSAVGSVVTVIGKAVFDTITDIVAYVIIGGSQVRLKSVCSAVGHIAGVLLWAVAMSGVVLLGCRNAIPWLEPWLSSVVSYGFAVDVLLIIIYLGMKRIISQDR